MSPVHARCASWPVTFCSRIAGTSDSRTAPVRGIRMPTSRRASWPTSGWPAGIGPGSWSSRSTAGMSASARSAPGPCASTRISSPLVATPTATGPSALRVAHHARPASRWMVGSPRPRDSGPSVRRRSSGRSSGIGASGHRADADTLSITSFRYKGVTLTVPVVDRGPFVAGRTWDLTHGACVKLGHCFTGSIDWTRAGA